MVNTDRKNIQDAVLAKLQGFTGSGQPLVSVSRAHITTFSGFPSASFEFISGDSEYLTTAENKRTYILTIYIHQEFEKLSGGREVANDIIAETLDTIHQAFEEDPTLGGVVDFCLPAPSDWGEYKESQGQVRFGGLDIRCVKSVQVVS